MTIRELKKLIENLPDDMRIYADDGDYGMFSSNSEFVALVYDETLEMCVLQTKEDFDINNEIKSWYEQVKKQTIDEKNFWKDFYEKGYLYEDLTDPEMKEKAYKYACSKLLKGE